ncbi:MAG: AAA family ATPase [Rhodocyclales bacterium]|nr:AAA family ATPase [Rhodocyclales bacterium]
MYLEHFGLTEAPFRITPHTDFFFEGANRGATLEALLYAITHDEGIVKVSGEVGSGKTMLCRVLMERLPESVETIFLANPSLSRDEILFTLADELQVNLATNRISAVMRALQEHLIDLYAQGRQVVVLIDEAHAMPAETLEEIRLLSNLESNRHKLLQIVLFGQPELNDVLNRNEMRQLKERITHNFSLEPLIRSDVAQYINFRMRAAGYKGPDIFSQAALKRIASASLGLTRRVNILCDKALLAAFAGNTHQIAVSHVKAAIRDAEFRQSPLPRAGVWLGGAAVAALLLMAGLAYFGFDQPSPSSMQVLATPAPAAATIAPQPENASDAGAIATASPQSEPLDKPNEDGNLTLLQVTKELSQVDTKTWQMTRVKLEETQQWLETVADNRWFIQLLNTDVSSLVSVENFLHKAARLTDEGDLRVYSVVVKGTRRLGVIYGDYPSLESASKAMNDLPPALKVFGPYPRQVRRLKN